MRRNLVDITFCVGMVLKGLNAAVELVLGYLFLFKATRVSQWLPRVTVFDALVVWIIWREYDTRVRSASTH